MYGVLGEGDSDVETLSVLLRRLARKENLRIRRKGYDSCGELLRKGAAQLRLFKTLGCTRLIVCYDSDGEDPDARYGAVMQKIVEPAQIRPFASGMSMVGVDCCCCILIPVQEIEAWILADLQAVSKVFTSWRPPPLKENPEAIPNPKEYLERMSRQNNRKPIYHHAIHNKAVANYLDLDRVRNRCPSFGPLVNFILN